MSNESKTVIGYKGFDKGLTCRGIQFEIGKETKHEGEIKLCNKGLHFCENPLDVLRYYGPAKSEYAEVKAQGVSDETEKDSKRVCSSLTLTAKISLKAIITAGVSFLITAAKKKPDEPGKPVGYSSPSATSGNSSPSATSGYSSHSATSGNSSPSATSGNSSPSATSGDYSPSATSGYSSHSATSGYSSPSATSGDSSPSATSGNSSPSATSGNSSPSATSGNSSPSATSGKNSIACAIGREATAKSTVGNWLVLSEYDSEGNVKTVKTVKVDGKEIKADTFYKLIDGKFVKAE